MSGESARMFELLANLDRDPKYGGSDVSIRGGDFRSEYRSFMDGISGISTKPIKRHDGNHNYKFQIDEVVIHVRGKTADFIGGV